MAERTRIEQVVQDVMADVLESQLPQLREQLVRRVLAELQPYVGSSVGSGCAADLLKAISSIHAGTTQKEILRALLDGAIQYGSRAALFVVKPGSVMGWEARAFDNSNAIKEFSLDVSRGAPSQVLQTRATVTAKALEMDPKFISQFGAPVEDEVLILPLRLKDKVAALVYADKGVDSGGKLDSEALKLLVAATSAWLEVASLRKQAAKEAAAEAASSESKSEDAPVPVQTVSSFSDPFAGHAPHHAVAMPAEAGQSAMAAASAQSSGSGAAAAAAPAADAFAQMSPEDADVHRKAQRFARLLMDEIKLYNQAKVAEGRKKKDLYDRLKEDIVKSRSTYQKRYGNTAAASGDYFNNELIRSLAGDDISVLGTNFHR